MSDLNPPTEKKERKQDEMLSLGYRAIEGLQNDGRDILYCLEEDRFYIYECGIWHEIFDIKLLDMIGKCVPKINKYTFSQRNQIINNIKIIKNFDLSCFNQAKMLNFPSGMLEPYSLAVMPHKAAYYSTIQLPYNYMPDSNCDLWGKSLNEIMEKNQGKIELLQEFFGYCLVPDVKHKKALLLIGDSNAGKSLLLNVLRALLGKENCSSVPLKYLSNPQYTPMMVNRLANIDPDVAKDAANYEGEFKIITSGEPVNCNQKFVKAFEFVPYCRIVLAANIFPKITDHSSAFYTRLLVIPCERIFEENEQDRELFNKLTLELPGILNWALLGLKRLTARGRFEAGPFSTAAIDELVDDNNPTNIFFKEHLEIEMGSITEKGFLFGKYKAWCIKTENYTLSQARFGQAVARKYAKHTPKDTKESVTHKRIWRNLKFIESYEQAGEAIDWQNK